MTRSCLEKFGENPGLFAEKAVIDGLVFRPRGKDGAGGGSYRGAAYVQADDKRIVHVLKWRTERNGELGLDVLFLFPIVILVALAARRLRGFGSRMMTGLADAYARQKDIRG